MNATKSRRKYIFLLQILLTNLCIFIPNLGSAFSPAKQLKSTPFGVSAKSSSSLEMSSVQSVLAREILDSRGNPTVEVRK
jgi:hypothetical protein